MEFKEVIFQAWKVVKNDYGHGIPPIGHGIFLTGFRRLTIKLKEYKITISKANV